MTKMLLSEGNIEMKYLMIQRNPTDLSLFLISQNIVHVNHLLKICVIQLALKLVPHLVSCNMDRFQRNKYIPEWILHK